METVYYRIEDADGLSMDTKSLETAEKEYMKGHKVTEIKTTTAYTEHTMIELVTYEDKTKF